MSDNLTISFNIAKAAPSQYTNMPFDSVVSFNGKLVFFGETGVFEEVGDTDAGTQINAWVDTPQHDFGDRDQKSIEAFDIGYETAGELTVTFTGDNDTDHSRSFTLERVAESQAHQGITKSLKKYRYGQKRYWAMRIANVDGCDFSLYHVALAIKRRNRWNRK